MTATSALITTATAEIQTLTVGSRQMTLSIFRQLEEVHWAQLTPWGWVNYHPDKKCQRDMTLYGFHRHIIGTDHYYPGGLVRSQVSLDSTTAERLVVSENGGSMQPVSMRDVWDEADRQLFIAA